MVGGELEGKLFVTVKGLCKVGYDFVSYSRWPRCPWVPAFAGTTSG